LLSKSKLDDVHHAIIHHDFDIFCVSETWLTNKIMDEELALPGYHLLRQDRPGVKTHKQRGGGVLIFIKDEYTTQCHDTSFSLPVESLKISIQKPYLPQIFLFLIYRVSTTKKIFLKELEKEIENVGNNELIVIGDLNCDYLKPDSMTIELKSLLNKNNLTQLIKEPTRITENSQTLIDLIITNKPQLNTINGVLREVIADHDMIYTVRKKQRTSKCPIKSIKIRSFKNINTELLNKRILDSPWWIFDYCHSVKNKYEIFHKFVSSALNIYAPLKTVTVKHNRKKWLNTDYEKLSHLSKSLKKQAIKINNSETWVEAKKSRNKLTNLKRQLKAKVIKSCVEEDNNPAKKCWKFFNDETGRSKRSYDLPKFIYKGQEIVHEKEKLNALCETFVKQKVSLPPFKSSTPKNPDTLNEVHFTSKDVEKAIKKLDTTKPTGADGIPPIFYKLCSSTITPILVHIFNNMIKSGEFPNEQKKAVIIPLYKGSGAKSNPRNFRPISIISTFSKLLEGMLYEKMVNFLEQTYQLNPEQHAYRAARSTQSAILQLTNDIYSNGNNGEMTGALLADFSGAFDNLVHSRLLEKLRHMGISGNLLKWFTSYFHNRTIQVKKGMLTSDPLPLLRGTPQGSSLSGLLWNIYVADIPHKLQQSKCVQYADDCCATVSSKSTLEIQEQLQTNLNNLDEWCKDNGMYINPSKTKTILFHHTRKDQPTDVKLTINDIEIEQVKVVKYLGVLLDSKLLFREQYEKVCKDMTSRMYLLNRHKHCFSTSWLKIFCTSIIISKIDYCFVIWGNLSANQFDHIDKIMFRVSRLIILKCKKISLTDSFEKLNWLKSSEKLQILTLEYVFKHFILKSPLSDSLTFVKNVDSNPSRVTRTKHDFFKPRMGTFGQKSFMYRAINLWNELPFELKSIQTFNVFSSSLRQFVIKTRKKDYIFY
jgi:hypothetical protein